MKGYWKIKTLVLKRKTKDKGIYKNIENALFDLVVY